ncbi:hypothetical protein KC19_3G043000 [Ceratodon purpureus]|uniref:CASP-like protein n=1 Tax=Ceratodon purpureus TaxID=3225 RepID=A0A8T0IFS1_CERPU|nr:hypothetical protein KC19_3G043000 [Ceratodon purpureus]
MADGGAWQSGVFDNGRNFQHGANDKAPSGDELATVPGVPAAMYNPPAPIGGGKDAAYFPIISIALRCACIVFTVVGFAVIASNEGTDPNYYSDTTLWWKAINSSNMAYLLAIDVIVCAYSVVQLVLSVVNSCTGKPILSGPTTPASSITYVCDQALTYMLMAGCGAGACVSASFKKGESGSYACSDGFTVFCDKNAASVAMSFIAFLCIALSCAMAYLRVYKLAKT